MSAAVPVRYGVEIRPERDARLTEFGKATMRNQYLLPRESYQGLFARVASAYASDASHAQRLYDGMSKLHFMPATPILANGGAGRGLPISCYLNEASDSLEGIVGVWNENVWLGSHGGGIGTYWGNLRPVGEAVGRVGETSGIIPFIHVMDGITVGISQGSLRRGAGAVYLDVGHPEIEEFLELRRPSGDFNRKAVNLHHGVMIPNAFMVAVERDEKWDLLSPKTGRAVKTLPARELWMRILDTRVQTGEPYLVFADTVNSMRPPHHQFLGMRVKTSNLCSETLLPTGVDHRGRHRTAVCCLASMNLETFREWRDSPTLIDDVMMMLDNVLDDFAARAPSTMERAVYSATHERSVGLGAMGFHSFLQNENVPFESVVAKSWNGIMFSHIRSRVDAASVRIAAARGACQDAIDACESDRRFSYTTAVAPTASISIIAGGTSAGIEPVPANAYTHKTLAGSFLVRSRALDRTLRRKLDGDERKVADAWREVTDAGGSAAGLTCLTDTEKAVFRTAQEIDQRWVIDLAADRAPLIDQGQSVNLFLPADVEKWDLHMLHFSAWKKGLKSLYYLRSTTVHRASGVGSWSDRANDYEECQSCQ